MTAIIPKETLERLIALGRDRGHLTTQDLVGALPVETMAPDEIALVVVHLEEAGGPVELDEALLAPGPHAPTKRAAPAEIELVDRRADEEAPSSRSPADPRGGSESAPLDPTQRAFASTHWAVALGGLLAVVLLALLILSFAR